MTWLRCPSKRKEKQNLIKQHKFYICDLFNFHLNAGVRWMGQSEQSDYASSMGSIIELYLCCGLRLTDWLTEQSSAACNLCHCVFSSKLGTYPIPEHRLIIVMQPLSLCQHEPHGATLQCFGLWQVFFNTDWSLVLSKISPALNSKWSIEHFNKEHLFWRWLGQLNLKRGSSKH